MMATVARWHADCAPRSAVHPQSQSLDLPLVGPFQASAPGNPGDSGDLLAPLCTSSYNRRDPAAPPARSLLMSRRFASLRTFRAFAALSALALVQVVAAGCGVGGSSAKNNVQHPLVRQFSPTMSPIDFNTGQANPTFT